MRNNFASIQIVFTLGMYFLGACFFAAAILPTSFLFFHFWNSFQPQSDLQKGALIAGGIGLGYFIFGLTLTVETVLFRLIFRLKLKEGEYSLGSLETFKWAFVNSLILIVKYTFMNFMKVTPFLPLYYRWMGAKVGKRVQINTTDIGDVSLLEICDDAVIGGEVVLIGHLAEHGKLKLKRTKIGQKVTIGLGSVIMPGCEIGDGSLIAARSVLLKNTVVPPNSIFAGSPAKWIRNVTE